MAELVDTKPPEAIEPVGDAPQAPLMPDRLEPGVGIPQVSRRDVEQMRAGLSSVGPLTHAVLHNNGAALLSLIPTGTIELPVGTILWFAGSVAPAGFVEADGSAVSRTVFADLFSVIGTSYGVGDGSTTFNVPTVSSTTGIYVVRV